MSSSEIQEYEYIVKIYFYRLWSWKEKQTKNISNNFSEIPLAEINSYYIHRLNSKNYFNCLNKNLKMEQSFEHVFDFWIIFRALENEKSRRYTKFVNLQKISKKKKFQSPSMPDQRCYECQNLDKKLSWRNA